MERYNKIRLEFEEAYKDYLEKLSSYNSEYEKGKNYVLNHKSSYKELTYKATLCSNARTKANELWNICLSHPLHKYFRGYLNPETTQYGIK